MEQQQEDKYRILEFLRNYGLVIFVWVVLISFLGSPTFGPISSAVQTIALLFWAYFGHIAAHKISAFKPFDVLNPHMSIHHKNTWNVPRWANLLQETIVNLAGFLFILPLQTLFGVQVFSTSIVVAAGLLYVLVHIADYSIRGNQLHKEHHAQDMCNYAPDFMDVIFKTRCGDQSAPFVDHTQEIIHGVIAVGAVYGMKKIFKWT